MSVPPTYRGTSLIINKPLVGPQYGGFIPGYLHLCALGFEIWGLGLCEGVDVVSVGRLKGWGWFVV